jgi:hypothetical protein
MAYLVYFKSASLKQIFTLSAGRYIEDCVDKLNEQFGDEKQGQMFAGIIARPRALAMTGKLTDEMREKLLALPFVKEIETWDDTRKRYEHQNRAAETVKGWVQDVIYHR